MMKRENSLPLTRILVAIAIGVCSLSVKAQWLPAQVDFANTYRLNPGENGEIDTVLVAVGDKVEVGAVVAEMKNAHLYAALRAAKSKKNLMQAQYEETDRASQRSIELYEEGSLSRVDLDLSQIALLRATALLDESKATYSASLHRLNQSKLMAPASGVVTQVNALEGERIVLENLVDPVIVLGSGDSVVTAEIPLAEKEMFSVGKKMKVRVKRNNDGGVIEDIVEGVVVSMQRFDPLGRGLIRIFAEVPVWQVGIEVEISRAQ